MRQRSGVVGKVKDEEAAAAVLASGRRSRIESKRCWTFSRSVRFGADPAREGIPNAEGGYGDVIGLALQPLSSQQSPAWKAKRIKSAVLPKRCLASKVGEARAQMNEDDSRKEKEKKEKKRF